MADEPREEQEPAAEADGEREGVEPEGDGGGPSLITVGLIVVGLAAGGGAGALLVGPALAESGVFPGGEPAAAADSGTADHGSKKEKKGTKASYKIENLIVNPKGTEGTRFLMVTLVLELEGKEPTAVMEEREPEFRDLLIRTLGGHTVEELAAIERRGTLKEELRGVLQERLEEVEVRKIYLPRYVIQ